MRVRVRHASAAMAERPFILRCPRGLQKPKDLWTPRVWEGLVFTDAGAVQALLLLAAKLPSKPTGDRLGPAGPGLPMTVRSPTGAEARGLFGSVRSSATWVTRWSTPARGTPCVRADLEQPRRVRAAGREGEREGSSLFWTRRLSAQL